MLARGSLKHYARVWKSASSLHEAGYEVLVLGSAKRPVRQPAWQQREGVSFLIVPLPELRVPRRLRWAEGRARHLEKRRDQLKQRIGELRSQAGSDRRVPLLDRVASKSLKRRLSGTRRRAAEARARSRRLSAAFSASRSEADPNNLSVHEAAWWPLVRQLRPDAIHVHDISGLSTARRAARQGVRWIYDAHEPKRHFGEEGLDAARRRQVAEHASRADAVVSTTGPLAEVLVEELGLSTMPTLVYNAPSLRAGADPPIGLREAARVSAYDTLLVYAGVLTRHRRLDVVLEAMTMLPEVVLALGVGKTDPFTPALLARAEELGVSARVRLVPKVPPASVVPYVAEADVGVNPLGPYAGGDRALPNKVFEYLHAGLPMVVSESPAMADFVRTHGLGEVASVDDAGAWAQAIRRVLTSPRYRDRISEWERLKQEWCWERQAERLLAVYGELVGPAPPDAGEPAPSRGVELARMS
jgi:glycosyltransferase involved in cell wall biosynthesis